jgi:Protein of unknown function (DUF3570)
LQLARTGRAIGAALAAALATAAAGPAAAATAEATQRVTLFREPSSTNQGVTVIHPQTSASAAAGAWKINVGHEVDIVSGASNAVFAPRTGIDAITSATKFSDTRQESHLNIGYDRPSSGVTLGSSYGWESDYRSWSVSGTTHSDLLDHNFTLALGYTHNFDDVCDHNNTDVAGQPLQLQRLTSSAHCFDSTQTDVVKHRLNIDTFEPSLSWTATPRLILQGGATIQILDGFQSNPYRSVLVGSSHLTPQEHEPNLRQRYAVFGRGAYAVPAARASAQGMVRLYRDSWAVQAATAELQLNKYVEQSLLFTLRGRYHIQEGASFYRSALDYRNLGPVGQYWTGDRELAPMSNYLLGGKMALLRRPEQQHASWFLEMELDVKVEILVYQIDPDAPNSDRKFANIWSAAFSMRF